MSDIAAPSGPPAEAGFVDDAIARAVFDLAPDGIVVVGSDGALLACNAAFLTLWNFPPDMLSRPNAHEMRAHGPSAG